MDFPWRQACLLLALLVFPITFAAFCVRLSRQRQGRLISYFAYYMLFGFVGQWLLTAVLWPSGLSRLMYGMLVTAAPVASLGLAVALQWVPSRLAFDTGAMVGCYVYPLLVAAGVAFSHAGAGG